MALDNNNLPPDPFKSAGADLTQFAANCFTMYTAFVAAGFTKPESFEFTVRLMQAMFSSSAHKT